MASVVINGDTSGSITLQSPSVAGSNTISLPANTGTAILDFSTPAYRNRIINGAMVIDQRNAGASVTPTSGGFSLDRWKFFVTQASKLTAQQNSGSVTPPVGFSNYLGVVSSSAYAVGSTDYFCFNQPIEGFNTSDFAWGTSNAATVTLSFWVRSSLTGTFGASLNNGAFTRSYPFSYTVSAANTWQYITVTIAGDTTGTWIGGTNGIGLNVTFGLGSGATNSGTAGAWAAGFLVQPTGTQSVVGTNGATFYITGVQLEKGSTATSFDYRPYGTELALCQRYCQVKNHVVTTTNIYTSVDFMVQMRAAPSVNTVTFDAGTGATFASYGAGAAANTGIYQNANHSQVATATIVSSAEL